MLRDTTVTSSAPGSFMLLGEYGVLHGMPAIVCAVDKRINVTLKPRLDTRINIHSDALGDYQTDLNELIVEAPYQFVLAAIQQYKPKMHRGCDITIESEFSHTVGLGSSAAVTVATIAALVTWLEIRTTPFDLMRQGRNVIRACQGTGSGADIAASVYGGAVYYQSQPMSAEKLDVQLPITMYYSGFKTKTADAIEHVTAKFAPYPKMFQQLCTSIGQCATEGMYQIRRKDWSKLGEVMDMQQGLMESLGVSLPLFQYMTKMLREQKNISGAKISGSGLGDCVIALGKADDDFQMGGVNTDVKLIPVEMSLHGVRSQKI